MQYTIFLTQKLIRKLNLFKRINSSLALEYTQAIPEAH